MMKRILEWNQSFNLLLKNFLLERALTFKQYNSHQFWQETKDNLKIQPSYNLKHQFFQDLKDKTLLRHQFYLVNKVNHKIHHLLINLHFYLVKKVSKKIQLLMNPHSYLGINKTINNTQSLGVKEKFRTLTILKNKRTSQ